jgi:hypothetical protein
VVPVFLVFVLPPIAIARGAEAVGEHRAIYESWLNPTPSEPPTRLPEKAAETSRANG